MRFANRDKRLSSISVSRITLLFQHFPCWSSFTSLASSMLVWVVFPTLQSENERDHQPSLYHLAEPHLSVSWNMDAACTPQKSAQQTCLKVLDILKRCFPIETRTVLAVCSSAIPCKFEELGMKWTQNFWQLAACISWSVTFISAWQRKGTKWY